MGASVSAILTLNNAAVESILKRKELSFKDVLNFTSTCKAFHALSKSNDLWETKFFQRWPEEQKFYQSEKMENWLEEVKFRQQTDNDIVKRLDEVSARMLQKKEISSDDFVDFTSSLESCSNPRVYYATQQALWKFVQVENSDVCGDLTKDFYARILFDLVKKHEIKAKLQKFYSESPKDELLETGLEIISDWRYWREIIKYSLPMRKFSKIEFSKPDFSQLDEILSTIKVFLKYESPSHPLFQIHEDVLKQWQTQNLSENQFDVHATRQIINCIRTVMIDVLKFKVDNTKPIEMKFEHEIQSHVSLPVVLSGKKGSVKMLQILFICIARRLGVRCELVQSTLVHRPETTEFVEFLGWKERYADGSHDSKFFSIKLFTKEKHNVDEDYLNDEMDGETISLKKIMIDLSSNILQSVKNEKKWYTTEEYSEMNITKQKHHETLINVLQQEGDFSGIVQRKVYYTWHLDIKSLTNYLIDVCEINSTGSKQEAANENSAEIYDLEAEGEQLVYPKYRDTQINYAVGIVLEDSRAYGDKCVVVVGWERVKSSIWYKLLHDDGRISYEKQDFIKSNALRFYNATSRIVFKNPLGSLCSFRESSLGKYFCKFTGTYFVPNEPLANIYVEDTSELKDTIVESLKMKQPRVKDNDLDF